MNPKKGTRILLAILAFGLAAIACGSEPAPPAPAPVQQQAQPTQPPAKKVSAVDAMLAELRAAGFSFQRASFEGETTYDYWNAEETLLCSFGVEELYPMTCVIDVFGATDPEAIGEDMGWIFAIYGVPMNVMEPMMEDLGNLVSTKTAERSVGRWFYMMDFDGSLAALSVGQP